MSADIDSIRDSAIELLDPESIGVAVGTALLSCLEADIYVLPVLAAANLHFRLPVTSESFLDSPVELLDPENVGVAVEISFLCAIEAELHSFYAVFAWNDIYYRFCSHHIGILGGVRVNKLAISRK